MAIAVSRALGFPSGYFVFGGIPRELPPDIPGRKAAIMGKPLTPEIQQRLMSAPGAAQMRIPKPRTPGDMAARESRLNVQVDDLGQILSVWCDLNNNHN